MGRPVFLEREEDANRPTTQTIGQLMCSKIGKMQRSLGIPDCLRIGCLDVCP
jgi:hypothetical protein